MADKKISELTALTTPDGTEELIVNDSGVSKKITQSNLLKGIDNTAADATAITIDASENVTLAGTVNGLEINTTATSNLGLGTGAVDSITTGDYNVGVGDGALTATTTGYQNTASGHRSLYSNTTGYYNTASGSYALYANTTASYNTAIGRSALETNTTGANNTASGYAALLSNTTGYNNTASGYNALYSNTTGANNTALGYQAGDNITTGSSNIIIGASVDAPSATASNQLNIGGWITGAAGAITVPGSLTTAGFTSTGIDDNATSTAITIDASENVGIGVVPETSNKTGDLHGVWGSIGGWSNTMFFNNNAYYNGGWKYKNTASASSYESKDGKHIFYVAPSGTADSAISWTTAMTIDNNDDIQIGKTDGSQNTQGIILNSYGTIRANSQTAEALHLIRSTAGNIVRFYYNNTTQVGNINVTSTATAYNTSSDYRLKENVVPMTGSIDRLKELKPSKFNFIADADTTVDGFLAHEAGEVVPECVSGEKDAMMDEEYEVTPAVMDGETVVTEAVMGTRSVPDYQGIDQSKLVPLLVASLQEAIARIEVLENA